MWVLEVTYDYSDSHSLTLSYKHEDKELLLHLLFMIEDSWDSGEISYSLFKL